LLLLIIAAAFRASPAQDLDNTSIAGRIVDQHNAVIADATIEAVLVRTGLSHKIKTNPAGRFNLHHLEPGSYSLRISAAGFAELKQNLVLISAQKAQLEITLYLRT